MRKARKSICRIMTGALLATVGSIAAIIPSTQANASVAGTVCKLANDGNVYQYGGDSTWDLLGGPMTTIYGGGYGVFGIGPDDNIYSFGSKVRLIGTPAATLAVSNNALYALSPDHRGIWQYSGSGTSWSIVGGRTNSLYAGGYGLFAIDPGTKNIMRYINGDWEEIGAPAATLAVSNNALYALSADYRSVWQYSGFGTNWSRIGGRATELYAGGYGLFAIDPDSKGVVRYINGGWQEIGTPGSALAVSNNAVYALSGDRGSIWQYSGSGNTWSRVGGAARTIVPCS